MENCENLLIEADGIDLSAAVHLPKALPAPVIVCSHGLLSLKESPKFLAIGEEMSRAGFCVLRFDFSGCGQSPSRKGASLVEARRRDLDAVIEFAFNQPWSSGLMGLMGSSMGGFLSLLAADHNPERIRAAVAWAAPFDISGIHPLAEGFAELRQMFPDGYRLGEPKNLDCLCKAARVLLIHGQQDEVVEWRQAVRIYSRLKDPRELLLLRTADHRISNESWRKAAIRASLDWFQRHLR